jgi:hypothetical protein
MKSDYQVIIADDTTHEKVLAEINYQNKCLAMFSQEQGVDRLLVELPGPGLDEEFVIREAPLAEFIALLKPAAEALAERRK